MLNLLKGGIKRLLRVPPEPHPPAGAPGSMRVFRAASGFFRYKLLGWGITQTLALVGIIAGAVASRWFIPSGFWKGYLAIEGVATIFFLIQLPISFLLIVLDYEYRWYMVTDRSLRIREGLIKVQERTMTFSNLQNVSIRQGPIQRFFGISDVEVRTAGGGAASSDDNPGENENLHLGYFRGVDNADEIRDIILDHLKQLRTGGLGDPDEPAPATDSGNDSAVDSPAEGDDLLDAARHLLAEARSLREVARANRHSPAPAPRP